MSSGDFEVTKIVSP